MGKMKMRKPGRVIISVNISLDLDVQEDFELYQAMAQLAKQRIMASVIKSQLLTGNSGLLKPATATPCASAAAGSFAF